MTNSVKMILIVVLLIGGFFGQNIVDFAKNIEWDWETNEPVVKVVEPSLKYKEVVSKISDMDIERNDANKISDFYMELASVVKNDPMFIKSTGVFREFNMTAGGLNFAGSELKDKYPELGEEIDAAIIASIGVESTPLTDSARTELVECLLAIAWAVQQ